MLYELTHSDDGDDITYKSGCMSRDVSNQSYSVCRGCMSRDVSNQSYSVCL